MTEEKKSSDVENKTCVAHWNLVERKKKKIFLYRVDLMTFDLYSRIV
jgi:hypothetical protein